MRERHAFDSAIIRVVPRVEREEFVNVGVIVYCQPLRFLAARVAIDWARIESFAPGALDRAEIEAHLAHLVSVAAGDPAAGSLASLTPQERFYWLVAPRSTVIQVSSPHSGFCTDPAETLQRLMDTVVLWHRP